VSDQQQNDPLAQPAPTAPLAPPIAPPAPIAPPPPVDPSANQPEPPREVPTVTHNRPTLAEGSTGKDVMDLVRYLAAVGYATNDLAQGRQTVGYLDNTVMNDVRAFASANDVSEDVEGFQGREGVRADQVVDNHVGPQIWQKLIEVAAGGHDVLA
jgi:hypothetical protein